MTVVKFTGRFRRSSLLTPAEIHSSPSPSDDAVWELCPYLRSHLDDSACSGCPEWEEDESLGKFKRMCRALSEEACKVAAIMEERSR